MRKPTPQLTTELVACYVFGTPPVWGTPPITFAGGHTSGPTPRWRSRMLTRHRQHCTGDVRNIAYRRYVKKIHVAWIECGA